MGRPGRPFEVAGYRLVQAFAALNPDEQGLVGDVEERKRLGFGHFLHLLVSLTATCHVRPWWSVTVMLLQSRCHAASQPIVRAA